MPASEKERSSSSCRRGAPGAPRIAFAREERKRGRGRGRASSGRGRATPHFLFLFRATVVHVAGVHPVGLPPAAPQGGRQRGDRRAGVWAGHTPLAAG